ncbi:MAG: large-conductance mechanosensitive channel protein MscL [Bacillota bacterium]|nr:large-conductance mechanosensitive channel protein MscL [Bacillota bacterium]
MKGFKEFISKGNVIDLAVGVIIGGAFGKIVASLVNDVIMPLIGMVLGQVNFTELKWVLSAGDPEVAVYYGKFIQNIVDFLIIALCIYVMVSAINKMRTKKEEPAAEEAPAEPSEEVVLLTEIRDLLKK